MSENEAGSARRRNHPKLGDRPATEPSNICRRRSVWAVLAVWLSGVWLFPVAATGPAPDPARLDHPDGTKARTLWTTSHVTGIPEEPLPYRTERVFPNLKFNSPVDFCTAPGSDRLFVVELGGKIVSFPIRTNCETADLFLDLSNGIKGFSAAFGITFDPQYEANHFVYVAYLLQSGKPDGSHVSRFTVSQDNPPRVDPATETVLITWPAGGHNGECIKFGPDGYLYISTGDGAAPDPPDGLHTGQDISDLLASILRIDVNHPAGGKAYGVPPDNPFVNLAGARPEVWAYGLRNPFKMSFDQKTGNLWVGDVGYNKWEMIHLVKAGGNYVELFHARKLDIRVKTIFKRFLSFSTACYWISILPST
jgi:hypothetical protein